MNMLMVYFTATVSRVWQILQKQSKNFEVTHVIEPAKILSKDVERLSGYDFDAYLTILNTNFINKNCDRNCC